jgi:serine acetyltransferase
VRVDRCSTLGIGTVVIDNVSITSGVRTGAGAVVIEDIAEPGLYVGIPARFKK